MSAHGYFTDALLVEDLEPTIEGLSLDLKSRGASVFIAQDAEEAGAMLRQDSWSLILYDLRIPQHRGDEPDLKVGLRLIKANLEGEFGERNRNVPFALISLQTIVIEADQFKRHPAFLGFFAKSEDSRRLFRTLLDRGLLRRHDFDEEQAPEERRRVKFLVRAVNLEEQLAFLSAVAWRDEECPVSLSEFRPHLRRELLSATLPVYLYGTANVAAASVDELRPAEFESELFPPAPPLNLTE